MNTRSILILTAILLFGVLVTTGLVLKSTSDTKTDSSRVTEGAAEVNGTELGANSIKLAPASQDKPPTVNVKKSDLQPATGEKLDPSQFKQALSEVEALKDNAERTSARKMLLARWGESDPKAAFDYAQGLENIRAKEQVLETVLDSFAYKDPEGAISFVTQLPAGSLRNAAMHSLVGSLASRDPDMAIALLYQVPPNALNGESGLFACKWAESDPKAALAWGNQQTDPELKAEILHGVLVTMAKPDPQEALAAALSLPPDSQDKGLCFLCFCVQ